MLIKSVCTTFQIYAGIRAVTLHPLTPVIIHVQSLNSLVYMRIKYPSWVFCDPPYTVFWKLLNPKSAFNFLNTDFKIFECDVNQVVISGDIIMTFTMGNYYSNAETNNHRL